MTPIKTYAYHAYLKATYYYDLKFFVALIPNTLHDAWRLKLTQKRAVYQKIRYEIHKYNSQIDVIE